MFFREKSSRNSTLPVLQLVENLRVKKGVSQKLIVSLGTKLRIPKENRHEVARIVKDRLAGQQSLFGSNPELIDFADKIVKKIQTEGKWNSVREQVIKFGQEVKEHAAVEIFVDDVQHGYDRELGPVLIGHCFWERLNFPKILSDCGFSDSQIKNAEVSILNRLIAQDSEHSILSWIKTVALDDILGLDTRESCILIFIKN